jgi:hypothetical protein
MTLKTPKEIWDYLKEEYKGDERIRSMQVMNLLRVRVTKNEGG